MVNINNLLNPAIFKNLNIKLNREIADIQNKLSSGQKLKNTGADPAAYSLSEDLKMDMNAYRQLKNNLEDSVSFLSAFTDGVSETIEILNRMNELLIKSSNATQSDDSINLIKVEIDQIITALDDNADKIRKINNKIFLTDTESALMYFRHGFKKDDVAIIEIKVLTSEGLNLNSDNLTDYQNLRNLLATVQEKLSEINIYRNEIAGITSGFVNKINHLDGLNVDITGAYSQLRDADAAAAVVQKTKLDVHNKTVNHVFKNIINMDRLKTDQLVNLLNKQ